MIIDITSIDPQATVVLLTGGRRCGSQPLSPIDPWIQHPPELGSIDFVCYGRRSILDSPLLPIQELFKKRFSSFSLSLLFFFFFLLESWNGPGLAFPMVLLCRCVYFDFEAAAKQGNGTGLGWGYCVYDYVCMYVYRAFSTWFCFALL